MELYHTHKEEMADNFEANKEKVNEYTDIESKSVRNKIAGYLTKYVKHMQKKEAKSIVRSQEIVLEAGVKEAEAEAANETKNEEVSSETKDAHPSTTATINPNNQ